MSASFWLEAGLNNDDGQGAASNSNNQPLGAFNPGTGANPPARSGAQGLTFNRRSTVSLAGNWGELRLGRDYTPQFWNLTVFDPFGTNGIGTTQTLNSIITGSTAVRASNSIGYFLPGNLGGFYGQYQHYFGENASGAFNSNDGTGDGFRVGWANGPINVALGMSETNNHPAAGTEAKIKQNNIGMQWDFGVAQVLGHYEWDSVGSTDADGWNIGALVPDRRRPDPCWPIRSTRSSSAPTRRAPSGPWVMCTTCPSARPCTSPGLTSRTATVLPLPPLLALPVHLASTRAPAASTWAFATASDHGRPEAGTEKKKLEKPPSGGFFIASGDCACRALAAHALA